MPDNIRDTSQGESELYQNISPYSADYINLFLKILHQVGFEPTTLTLSGQRLIPDIVGHNDKSLITEFQTVV